MEIDIKAGDINRVITDAIIKSAIGDMLEKSIKEAVDKLSRSYDNPMQKVIEQIMMEQVRELCVGQYKEVIRERIRERATDKLVDEFIDKLWESTWRNLG